MLKKPTSKAVFAEAKKLQEEEDHLVSALETLRLLILSQEAEHQQVMKRCAEDKVTLKNQETDMDERLAAVKASKLELERLALDLKRKGQ
jgi:gamma-glutamylcysteine synthetase